MPNTLDLSLRHAQSQVFSSNKRFRVLVAGRRFGKSYLACVELFLKAVNRPGETFFYCAPTYRMAKDIAWKTIKKIIPPQFIRSKNETDLKIELVNDSTIELKGTENAMALRGRSLAGVVLDEAAFMDTSVWFEVILPPSPTNKAGHCSSAPRMERPVGSTTCGVTYPRTRPESGLAGVLRLSRAVTSPRRRLRLQELNLMRELSAKSSRRRSRT